MTTKFRHDPATVTTKQLIDLYSLKGGEDVLTTRKRLEILGYIEAVRKGSQTYRLLRGSMPLTLVELESEYILTNYTYDMPADYNRHIVKPLKSMLQTIKYLDNDKWGETNHTIYHEVHLQLAAALDMLPELESSIGVMFICHPVHDLSILPYSRKRKLDNIAELLRCTANVFHDQYISTDVPFDTLTSMEAAASIISNIDLPHRLARR